MKTLRSVFRRARVLRAAVVAILAAGTGLVSGLRAAAPEPHADAILRELLATRDAIVAERHLAPGRAVFLVFWDFDGTILKGDCSEGLIEDGKPVYAGLAQVGIERGLVAGYKPAGGFAEFWKDYEYMDHRVGHWLAYPFIPQMFRGARADDVQALAREHFAATLAPYYFAASMHVLRGLESAGVENHVISASADFFVRGASATVGLPEARLHGIEVRVDAAGRVTSDIVPPVTWADGKRTKLLQIVAAAHEANPGAEVYVLAAFGNSYGTDAAFLEFTARQTLPAGRAGLAVMINGGLAPERYRGLFRDVTQAATVQ